jgi:hypothetical protein
MTGRAVYVQRGGILGRPEGSRENERTFLNKEKSQRILKFLNKKRTIREICNNTNCSNKTVIKVKRLAIKHNLLKADNTEAA